MKTNFSSTLVYQLLLNILLFTFASSQPNMITTITGDIETPFGVYHPYQANFTPNVSAFTIEPNFSNVQYMPKVSSIDSLLLNTNHFTVRKSRFVKIYDIYNSWINSEYPIFVTTDAVLHAYHCLFDRTLMKIEETTFDPTMLSMTDSLLNRMTVLLNQVETPLAKEAVLKNIAYFSVAKKLLQGASANIPDTVASLVNAELDLIAEHDGYHYSPILGDQFTQLDYSKFKVRGHYTRSETLSAYFQAMTWYGWTILAMETEKFGDLAKRHTLQALSMVQAILVENFLYTNWQSIYEPTVFFCGKTDDPNVYDYKKIAEEVYGSNFATLSIDSLANDELLNQFMEQAQLLPEPKIPNYIHGEVITFKGFRFMGQRMIPDSYVFSELVWPYITYTNEIRNFPRGLDVMAILGSERAFKILDSVYHETRFPNYSAKIDSFKLEFASKPDEAWVQNLYWNWLYCLMPLLYQKGNGYPYFMQTLAWSDKELLTALASWTELRHDAILYAKQGETLMSGIAYPQEMKNSYVEPNPYLYARLASLVRYTKVGLQNQNLFLTQFENSFSLLEQYLLFLRDVSIKELENAPLSKSEYDNIYSFGKILEGLVTDSSDLQNGKDNMAIVADVHTDANSNQCLEEGVGYPLEILVIVNVGGTVSLTQGAIYSYYEFRQPISNRLSDEEWKELLVSNPPTLPQWFNSFMDVSASQPDWAPVSPDNHFGNTFITSVSNEVTQLPDEIGLEQNYPNPFNPTTIIRYRIPNTGGKFIVSLKIFDLPGREVATLVSQSQSGGTYEVKFDGSKLASGVYFYRLQANQFVETRKLLLIK
ncbi:MAG TPA: DUF3160 domain-containing protein [Bacteroidota bacterium]|nr:DUF3160 domain-containing protein [Bacteroidota bacterium]